jgi:arylsulfatase A-like enzyme
MLNIVVILADDLGWRDLGCCGSTFYETPAIDRLASQGMRFTQAYAAANVCSPTRAALMTGCYPARLHTTNFFGGNRRGNQGGRPGGAVRVGNYKLVESFEDGRVELYNLSRDASEEHDLAATDSERANEMKKLLADWRKSVDAQMPTLNPEPVEPFGVNR